MNDLYSILNLEADGKIEDVYKRIASLKRLLTWNSIACFLSTNSVDINEKHDILLREFRSRGILFLDIAQQLLTMPCTRWLLSKISTNALHISDKEQVKQLLTWYNRHVNKVMYIDETLVLQSIQWNPRPICQHIAPHERTLKSTFDCNNCGQAMDMNETLCVLKCNCTRYLLHERCAEIFTQQYFKKCTSCQLTIRKEPFISYTQMFWNKRC